MPKAAIFDVDGTLLDSVDLHALSWHEAMVRFGHDVSFEQARSQIGKGGDKLIPHFLDGNAQRDHGKEMEDWRSKRFKSKYLPLLRPFSAVPDLLRRVRESGVKVAVASSAKKDELEKYLDIADVTNLVEVTTSSDDVTESKPAPDIFEVALSKLGMGRQRCRSNRRHALRCRSSRQGGYTDHWRTLRRLHRELAAQSWSRPGIPGTRRHAGLLCGFAARSLSHGEET
jgi:beta-phosphoglucomutase-like phosphatase (HAD superfamily)